MTNTESHSYQQLSLPVGIKETTTFESFVAGDNQHVVYHLLGLTQQCKTPQPEFWLTYLFGESGLGKSHLLYAMCQQAEQLELSCVYLSFKQHQELSVEMLNGLEQCALICLDDVDAIENENNWQVALFDLINRVKEHDTGCLVIAGKQSVNQLPLQLLDLKSRLAWGTNFKLQSLTDAQRMKALELRAKLRGINMSEGVSKFLIHHWRRDMPALIKSLDILDEQSLKQKRKLSISFVKSILKL